jgi:hypothetical protein
MLAFAQNLQYALLSKHLAIAGDLLLLFVTGAGPLSIDKPIFLGTAREKIAGRRMNSELRRR